MSIRAIARILGVDSKTVLKYMDVKHSEHITINEARQRSNTPQKLLVGKETLNNRHKKVQNTQQVDWNERDEEYYSSVKVLYSQLIDHHPFVRITKTNLAKRPGKAAMFEHKLDSLPKTKQLLSEITETVQQFQLRRCKKAIDLMIVEQGFLQLWKIQRVAAVKSHHFKQLKPVLTEYVHMKQGRCDYEYENNKAE